MIVIASDPSISFPKDRTTKRVREAAALFGQVLETELPKGDKILRDQEPSDDGDVANVALTRCPDDALRGQLVDDR